MENKQQKLKEVNSRGYQQLDKKSLIVGSIIATFLAITPFLYYLYESVPDEKVWSTFLFTYESGHFENANIAMWIFTGKIVPLFLIFIWFFTNRHWWYHVLLVPMAMYIYQIIHLFYDDRFLDQFQLIYMVPIMAIVIPSIYLIRARIFNKINEASKSLEELEAEFKISPKNFWEKIKQYF
jgi:signal transduction histidine kinase